MPSGVHRGGEGTPPSIPSSHRNYWNYIHTSYIYHNHQYTMTEAVSRGEQRRCTHFYTPFLNPVYAPADASRTQQTNQVGQVKLQMRDHVECSMRQKHRIFLSNSFIMYICILCHIFLDRIVVYDINTILNIRTCCIHTYIHTQYIHIHILQCTLIYDDDSTHAIRDARAFQRRVTSARRSNRGRVQGCCELQMRSISVPPSHQSLGPSPAFG